MKIAAGKKEQSMVRRGRGESTLKTRNAARKEQSLQVRTAVVAQGAEGACHAAGQATLGHVPSSSLLSFYFTLLLLLLLSQVACYIIHTSLMATCAHVDLPPPSSAAHEAVIVVVVVFVGSLFSLPAYGRA